MENSFIHDRIARIARDVLRERFASLEDQADAMAAAIITELGAAAVIREELSLGHGDERRTADDSRPTLSTTRRKEALSGDY